MGPKSLHFQTPRARNLSMFAQLNIRCPKCTKIAPLPHENHIFSYFGCSKNYKKSLEIPSKTLQKSTSSWKCFWNPKNHNFEAKIVDFRAPKNSRFFAKSAPTSPKIVLVRLCDHRSRPRGLRIPFWTPSGPLLAHLRLRNLYF